ncbi:MAG TPA: four helix bundle protein [Gemmatimonadaceae bacterium]|nr:four helix bundle protein [Gemmatimonadaceae bacterium]
MAHRDLDVLDAAEQAVDGINRLIDRDGRRLLHAAQMRDSVQSIAANISEAFGKSGPRDRARSLEIARAETEETLSHLGANFRSNRVAAADYWPLRNRLVVIAKMLSALIHRLAREPRRFDAPRR